MGKVVGVGRHLAFETWRPAGEHGVSRRAVRRIAVRQRSNDSVLIRVTSQTRKMFRDLNARDIGGLRFELAANFRGRRRLHVPNIDVARSAEEINQNARPRLTKMTCLFGRGALAGDQRAARRTKSCTHSHAQHISPGPPLPQIYRATPEDEHRSYPCRLVIYVSRRLSIPSPAGVSILIDGSKAFSHPPKW